MFTSCIGCTTVFTYCGIGGMTVFTFNVVLEV